MPRLVSCWIVLLLVGCADSHEVIRTGTRTAALAPEASAYVALPADGRYGQTVYQGSGMQTAQTVADAFAPWLRKVLVAGTPETVEDARRSAEHGGYDYLLYSQILHWEDRATEWSAKPDVVSVELSVIQVSSGTIVDHSVINGRSGLATLGGDHPQDLLPPALKEYTALLFH
jgi:Domain of unknown function (DUF4823)